MRESAVMISSTIDIVDQLPRPMILITGDDRSIAKRMAALF
jgi:hypothetical protein